MSRLGRKVSWLGAAATTAVASAVAKPANGYVCSFYVFNLNATVRYFILWDRVTLTTGGEVPGATSANDMIIAIPPSGGFVALGDIFSQEALDFTNGIVWSISTSRATNTLTSTPTDHDVTLVIG
jgi:hypothetical protein